MTVGTLCPPRRPVAAGGRQSVTGIASPSRAVIVRCSLSTNPLVWRAAGRLRVRWRGRRGSVPSAAGTGRIQRSSGSRHDSPTARMPPPSGNQATASQTPSNGSMRTAAPDSACQSAAGCFRGRPGLRLSGATGASGATYSAWNPSRTTTCTNRVASGDGSGATPKPPPGAPCSTGPAVRALRSVPSALMDTTWNQPSASLRRSRPLPSGSQRAPVAQSASPAIVRSSPDARSTIVTWFVCRSGRRCAMSASRVPSGAQAKSSISTLAGVTGRGSGATNRAGGRPRRGSGASCSQTWLQPRRREMKASCRPSGAQRGARLPAG